MKFITQRREGAKIVNSLTLRLCVRIFPGLSIHAVFYKSWIGGIYREVSPLTFIRGSFCRIETDCDVRFKAMVLIRRILSAAPVQFRLVISR